MRERNDGDRKSRSQLKREALASQELGERLARLAPETLLGLPIPPELREAVLTLKGLSKHEARRRQAQYIGVLMRRADAQAVQAALEGVENRARSEALALKQVAAWRDGLTAGEAGILDEVCVRLPKADPREINELAETARAERAAGRPPRAFRALFRRLKELLDQDAGAGPAAP
jgi:ribosome-associated protein